MICFVSFPGFMRFLLYYYYYYEMRKSGIEI